MKILSSYKQFVKHTLFEAEESDKYVHIGYGKYKEKGKEDDKDAQTFQKDDSGKFSPAGDKKGGEEVPDSQKLSGAGEFERPGSEEKPSGESSQSDQAVSALGSEGSDEQAENLYQLIQTPEDNDDPVLGKEHEVESDDGEYTYDSPGWEIIHNIAVKARDSDNSAETFKKEFENAPPEVQKYILANTGKGKEESVIEVNGVKYAPVVSEEDDKHSFSEMFKRIGRR